MSTSIKRPTFHHAAIFSRSGGSALPFCVRLFAFVIAMFSASSAVAWGFGEMRLQSALGQPLKVQIGLLGDDAGKAEALCFKASFQSLDGVSLGGVTVALQADNPLIRLTTTRNINEPAAALIVSYTCPPHIKREYTILLDPLPTRVLPVVARQPEATQPVMSSRESAAQATNAAASDTPVKKSRRRANVEPAIAGEESPAAAPVQTRAARKKNRDKPSEPVKSVLRLGQNDASGPHPLDGAGGVHLSLSYALRGAAIAPAAAVAAAASEPVAAAEQPSAVPLPAPVENVAALAQAAQASAMTQLMEKIQMLENKTEDLRKQNNLQLTALETAQKNQASTSSDYLLYFLLFVCLAAIGWLMWRMHKIRSQVETSSWQEIVPYGDDYPYPERGWDVEPPAVPPLADAGKATVEATAESEPLAAAVVAKVTAAAAASFDDAEHYYDNRLKVSAAEEISDETQQAEFWLNMNQPLRAIEVLEAKPDHERPTSPLHWLNLIDLYRLAGEREKYEQLAARFKSVFNGRVTPWDDAEALKNSRSLESFPVVMDRIVQLWHTDALLSFLENLLIDERDGAREGFDLAAYRDILFLTNIAHGVKAAKRFEKSPAAPDWSIL